MFSYIESEPTTILSIAMADIMDSDRHKNIDLHKSLLLSLLAVERPPWVLHLKMQHHKRLNV